MNIVYMFHDSSNDSTYYGKGNVDTFGTGIVNTVNSGTFTNTSTQNAMGPIFVMVALTQKDASTIDRMKTRISDKSIPTQCFFFIPSVAFSVWSHPSDDTRFWASLPLFKLIAGKTYKGYYVPLTALPPFGSRAEIGTVMPETKTVTAADFFYFSAAYFNTAPHDFDSREEEGKKYLTIAGGDSGNYSTPMVDVANANLSLTFAYMIYSAIDSNGTPELRANVTDINANGKGGFTVTISINTSALSGRPMIALRDDFQVEDLDRHGLDSIGNSGYINNKDISFDTVMTMKAFDKDIDEIRVNREARTVAGITYVTDYKKRLNLYLSL